ncbi:MAG: nucleotidyltransferase domain-containing protein, partial [Candidatus Cloacimonetes bacterium]|nr:nucleotidyltransferase domain-containing protein [Candidatus Cloacimonadota bacterium]
VSAIYLFGSYATGHFHEDSDLDIYIVTPDRSKRKVEIHRDARIAIGFPKKYPMDILIGYDDDFERRSKLICTVENEVFMKGKVL